MIDLVLRQTAVPSLLHFVPIHVLLKVFLDLKRENVGNLAWNKSDESEWILLAV
jgi:hypothetical protein